ncbi:NAD(P)/FAD-dependent oxidoreductase [Patescibacteria group bacterium]
MKKKPSIVVLGGGYGGTRTALELLARRAGIITLVDRNQFHSMTPAYYKVASSFIPEKSLLVKKYFEDISKAISVPFSDIFKQSRLFKFVQSEVVSIDLKKKIVKLKNADNLQYDWLIMALGNDVNYYKIPSLEEFSFGFKTAQDAFNIRNAVNELFAGSPKHKRLNIIIAGAGPTGVELAGEMAGFMERLSEVYGHPKENHSCVVLESSNKILGNFSSWTQKNVLKRLQKLRVKVFINSHISQVSAKKVELKNKQTFPYDVLIWTAGLEPSYVHKASTAIGKYLRLRGEKNVFIIGQNIYPMTAKTAIRQGIYVAEAIERFEWGLPVKPFKVKKSSIIIPIGSKYAFVDFGGLKLQGIVAWWLKILEFLKYLLSILSPIRAFKIWLKILKLY